MTRIRRDPRERRALRRPAPPEPAGGADVRDCDDRAGLVLALIDGDTARLAEEDRQALAFGRALADREGMGLLALVTGRTVLSDLAGAGADRVAHLPDAGQGTLTASLAAMTPAMAIRHWVARDETAAADAIRRFAARTGMPLRANVARLTGEGCDCLEDAGRFTRARSLAPAMLAARDHFLPAPDERPGAALPLAMPSVEAPEEPVRDLGVESPDASRLPLTEARLILAAGAGVTDWPLFHSLARALGAAEAGSRVVCDAGHLPRSRQVGASGTAVAPACYIALGISGAVQHLQGIADCPCVVAVNRDAHAPILPRADLAVTADAAEVMRSLLDLLERRE
jgi:electron transfer flavoprotein alpha subunit